MKRIELSLMGEKVYVTFNMKTQIDYERISGKAFSMTDMSDSAESRFALYGAAITSCPENKDLREGFVAELLYGIDAVEMKELDNAVSECAMDFFRIPKIMEEKKAKKDDGDEDEAKNGLAPTAVMS